MQNLFSIYDDVQKPRSRKSDIYIEIVGSSNPRLSAMVEGSAVAIRRVLHKSYKRVGISDVNTMDDLKLLVAKKPDLVVLGMKLVLLNPEMGYDDSPKVWLSTYLSEHNINFTGSDTDALAAEFDKHHAKQKVMRAGLHSAQYFLAQVGQPLRKHDLEFPLFVKPTNRGGSKGIDERSLVYSEAELRSKIASIHRECSSDALIEEYLPGREFSVAVMKEPSSGLLFAMPIEITSPADKKGNSFLSEAIKKADTEVVLEVSETILRSAINTLAIGVFEALGSRDYGRIDMRLDRDGKPSFIEANLMPGLSGHGYLSRCLFMNEQISYGQMITRIVDLGLQRAEYATSQLPVMFENNEALAA